MEDELYHYGVKGQKWGVRRARRAYSSGNYSKGNSIAKKHLAKSYRKVNKLNNQYSKLNAKRNKQILTSDVEVAELSRKALKNEKKAAGFFTSEKKSQKLLRDAAEYKAKATSLKAEIEETKAKMAKNEKIRELLNTNIKELEMLNEKYK